MQRPEEIPVADFRVFIYINWSYFKTYDLPPKTVQIES